MSTTPVRFALLGMLSLRPMTGYEIHQSYQQGPANFMPISFGQIYPLLAQLTKQKLVQKEKKSGGRGSVRYSIRPAGSRTLRHWLFAASGPMSHRDLLLRLFFTAPPDFPRQRNAVQQFHDDEVRRLDHYRSTRKWLHDEQGRNPRLFLWELVLEYGVSQTESRIRWAGNALTSIQEFKRRINDK